MIWAKGFVVVNVDIMVMAEEPKLSGYRTKMRHKIAEVLNVTRFDVGLKATTCEGIGTIGRREGIYAQAVVLLMKRNSPK